MMEKAVVFAFIRIGRRCQFFWKGAAFSRIRTAVLAWKGVRHGLSRQEINANRRVKGVECRLAQPAESHGIGWAENGLDSP